jgi:hypothetical protein
MDYIINNLRPISCCDERRSREVHPVGRALSVTEQYGLFVACEGKVRCRGSTRLQLFLIVARFPQAVDQPGMPA